MLALLGDGTVEQAATAGASWTTLAASGAVASSAAGRRCEVTSLTAVAYAPSGTPLAAASCARAGIAGIFAVREHLAGSWPPSSASARARQVTVLRLTAIAAGDIALLRPGRAAREPARRLDERRNRLDGLSPARCRYRSGGCLRHRVRRRGWLLLADGRAYAVSGPGGAWRRLPSPPPGTAALAAGRGGAIDALAADGGNLTVYQLTPAGAWGKAQVLTVPIQYGSSS